MNMSFLTLYIDVGVGMFLKSKNPEIKVVLADPQVNGMLTDVHESILS